MKNMYISIISGIIFLFSMAFSSIGFAQDYEYSMVVQKTVVNQENVVSDAYNPNLRKDLFGGFHFSGDIMVGIGRCDDKLCPGHYDDYNEEMTVALGGIQLEAGYFWGNRVFIGPTVSVTSGLPILIGAALNLKMYFTFSDHAAITASAGIGGGLHMGYEGAYYWGEESFMNDMYFPFQIGYEHVFDSHWAIGLHLQANLGFIVHDPDEPHCGDSLIEPILSSLTAGFNIGYKW